MACGLPVDRRSTPTGPAEIVDDGETGWLVPPDDEEALADALVEAVNDGGERRRRGERAYEEARARYAWPALARGLAQRLRRGRARAGRPSAGAHTLHRAVTRDPATGSGAPTRARRARIVVDGGGVEVVVPRRFPLRRRRAVRGGEAALDRAHAAAHARVRGRAAARRGSRTAARCRTWASASTLRVRVEPGACAPHVARRGGTAARGAGAPAAAAARRARALVPAPRARGGGAAARRRRAPARARATRASRSAASARAGPAARRAAR